MTDTKGSVRYRSNLRGEVDSAALYRTLAEVEVNPDIAQVYRRKCRANCRRRSA